MYSKLTISQTIDSNGFSQIDKEIDCSGSLQTIKYGTNFGNCNIQDISELSSTEKMYLELARQKCWQLGTQISRETMLQECSFQELGYQECSGAYLPKSANKEQILSGSADFTAINNILNSNNNELISFRVSIA